MKKIFIFQQFKAYFLPIICLVVFAILVSNVGLTDDQNDWLEYQRHGHKSPKWDGFVESGLSAFNSGNLGTGEMFLQRAIARGCEDGLIYAKVGLYYEVQRNYKKAAEFFLKAAKKLPHQYPDYYVTKSMNEYLGRVLFSSGNTEAAFPYLQKAASSGAPFTPLYFLGQIYKSKGDTPTAIKYFERALKAEHPSGLPKTIDILMMIEIGKGYYEMKNFDTSLEWWKKILEIDPGNVTAQSYKDDIQQSKYREEEKRALEEIVK